MAVVHQVDLGAGAHLRICDGPDLDEAVQAASSKSQTPVAAVARA
jgi:hypothetical protein